MKSVSLPLFVSVSVVCLVSGLILGFMQTPEYRQSMYEKSPMDLGPADNRVDLRYLNSMAAHHRGAILLAEQMDGKTDRAELATLVSEIKSNEPKLIDELYDWKKQWYADSRSVADPRVARIGDKDEKIDLRFLNALIAHHQAGIEMTKEIRTKSSRTEILNNADAVEVFLTNSLVTLKTWRQDWYGIK